VSAVILTVATRVDGSKARRPVVMMSLFCSMRFRASLLGIVSPIAGSPGGGSRRGVLTA
jgi:hypothetical protein